MLQPLLRSLFFFAALSSHQAICMPDISAYDAWVRAVPPGMAMTAGYLTVSNNSQQAISLVEVRSPAATRMEIHETRIHDGMARMRQIQSLPIAPGEETTLRPEGKHLMIWIKQDLPAPGKTLPLELIFDNGQRLTIQAEVRHSKTQSDHHHHHH